MKSFESTSATRFMARCPLLRNSASFYFSLAANREFEGGLRDELHTRHPVHIFFFPPPAIRGRRRIGKVGRQGEGWVVSRWICIWKRLDGERVGTALAQGWKNGRGLRGQPLVFTRRKYLVTKGLSTLILIPGFFLFSQRRVRKQRACCCAYHLQRSLLWLRVLRTESYSAVKNRSRSSAKVFLFFFSFFFENSNAELLDLLDLIYRPGKFPRVSRVALRKVSLASVAWFLFFSPLSFLASHCRTWLFHERWSTPPGYWISSGFSSFFFLSRSLSLGSSRVGRARAG